jgi:hypothetical protein
MKWRLVTLTAGLLLAGALLLAGCGSSGSSSTATTIDKATFIRRANAICEKTHEAYLDKGFAALAKVEKELPNATALDRELAVTERIYLPTYRKEMAELRALGAPPGDAKKINNFINTFESVLDEWEEDPRTFHEEQANFSHPYAKAFDFAERYGIRPCGQP